MGAISARKTIQEFAADHAIHPIQASQWKRQLLDGTSELFTRGKKSQGGGSLHAHKRALAAEDRQDRHQQHPPLEKADGTAHPAIRQCLEEADKNACSSRCGGELGGQGADAVPAHNTVGKTPRPGLLGQTSIRP